MPTGDASVAVERRRVSSVDPQDTERKDDSPWPCVVHCPSDFGQFSNWRQRRKQVPVTVVNEVEEEECVLEPSPSIMTEDDRSGGGPGYWPAFGQPCTRKRPSRLVVGGQGTEQLMIAVNRSWLTVKGMAAADDDGNGGEMWG